MFGSIGNLAAAAIVTGFQAVFGDGVAAPAFHFMAVAVRIQQYRFGFFSLIAGTGSINPFAVFAGITATQQESEFVTGLHDVSRPQRAVIDSTAKTTAALIKRIRTFNHFYRTGKLGVYALAGSV